MQIVHWKEVTFSLEKHVHHKITVTVIISNSLVFFKSYT